MGNARSPMKSHSKFAQTIRSSVGSSSLGSNVNESGVNREPHHGHSSIGIGIGLRFGSFLYWRTFDRAVPSRLSPFRPITFGVPALPTQSPISNGHAPYLLGLFSRSSSSAQ